MYVYNERKGNKFINIFVDRKQSAHTREVYSTAPSFPSLIYTAIDEFVAIFLLISPLFKC